ncbi:MAG: CPBP family intramembrane metalloprotease [Cyanobacteria bacterium]|nr:CPBP family intramembrane metalloprotease [Cyanobacteriota bacterium]MDW8200925.1 CPBP family intramembrane glutamic endopeptidase [Cyanobacteriota bacterium SKYGB_h_bin112]
MPPVALFHQLFRGLFQSVIGWTVGLLLTWVLLWLPLAVPIARQVKWHPPLPITPQQKIPLLVSLYLLAPVIIWGATHWGTVSLMDCGLIWRWSLLVNGLIGLMIGTVGVLTLFWVEASVGWISWHWNHQVLTACLPILVLGLGVSATEEAMFRGLFQARFQQNYSLWIAGAIVSLIFAVLHLVWEGADNLPQLPGLWLMGMVLTLAKVVDYGHLGLAWGLHAGWIWSMATLDTAQVIAYNNTTSPWILGFGNKPLAGLMGILFLAITSALLLAFRPIFLP